MRFSGPFFAIFYLTGPALARPSSGDELKTETGKAKGLDTSLDSHGQYTRRSVASENIHLGLRNAHAIHELSTSKKPLHKRMIPPKISYSVPDPPAWRKLSAAQKGDVYRAAAFNVYGYGKPGTHTSPFQNLCVLLAWVVSRATRSVHLLPPCYYRALCRL